MIPEFVDRLTSKGAWEQFWFGFILVLAALACACTFAHAGDTTLDVSAIAGRPADALQSARPRLDVAAIAGKPATCHCRNCSCATPHECGDPGCICSTKRAAASSKPTSPPAEPLNLSGISPQRRTVKPDAGRPSSPPTVAAAAKSKQPPHWEWRNVCRGGYCVRELVLVQ